MRRPHESTLKKTGNFSIVILLILIFSVFIATAATESYADDSSVTVTGRIAGYDGVWSSHDSPARVCFTPHVSQLTPKMSFKVAVDYEGLKPGMKYKVNGFIYIGIEGRYPGLSMNELTFTASDNGTGTYTSQYMTQDWTFWRDNYTGEGMAKMTLTPEDGSDPITVTADGESMSLKYCGISYMEMNGESGKEVAGMNYEVLDELSDTTTFKGKINMVNLDPDTDYTITAWCSNISGWQGKWIWLPQRVSDNIYQTVRSDSNGNVTFEPEYTVETSKLKPTTICMNMFSVIRSDGTGTEFYFYTKGYPNIYNYTVNMMEKPFVYLLKDKEPIKTPVVVDVTINNMVNNKNILLPGAEFKIVKGNNSDGEIVESWTQKKEAYKTRLPAGEYTLVQTKAPDGYKIAPPQNFTLTNNDAATREYSFLSDKRLAKTPDGEYFYHMSIYKFDEEKDPSRHEVVYCINHSREYTGAMDPTGMELMYYTEYDINDPILGSIIDNPRIETGALRTKLKQIALGGYPNDNLGLKEKFSLSSYELMQITQAAVHYYTDTIPYDSNTTLDGKKAFSTDNMYHAFMELINADINIPDGMTLKVYIPDNDKLQAVLSTILRVEYPDVDLLVENSKVKGVYEDKIPDPEEDGINPDKENDKDKVDPNGGRSSTGDTNDLAAGVMLLLLSASLLTGYVRKRRGM